MTWDVKAAIAWLALVLFGAIYVAMRTLRPYQWWAIWEGAWRLAICATTLWAIFRVANYFTIG